MNQFAGMTPEQIAEAVAGLSPAELEALDQELTAGGELWVPFPGPQEETRASLADEVFYGGQAGGGKTGLLLGLAHDHQNSIIFRREYPQLREVIEQSRMLYGKVAPQGYNSTEHTWRLPNGKVIEFGACQHEWDVSRYVGRPHDYYGFDEVPQMSRAQYRFIIAWNRSIDPKQRCRVVVTGNPPRTAEERWVIEEWAPWLDPEFPNPAVPGELRWYTVEGEKTIWLENGEPFQRDGEWVKPRSRTFIPAALKDNPVLSRTNYRSVLHSLPEPLRSQLLRGDFHAGMEDDEWQVIPTAWVRLAQKRWTERMPYHENHPMTALGIDVARGGKNKTTISRRYDLWFAPLIKYPGVETPDGPTAAAKVKLAHKDHARANIDVIGWGASAYDSLKGTPHLAVTPVNNSTPTKMMDRSGKFRLVNVRAASYWSLREALDPEFGQELMLPPDAEMVADLTCVRWRLQGDGIILESKEELIKRLGRSPDCGDSVVLCWWSGGNWDKPGGVSKDSSTRWSDDPVADRQFGRSGTKDTPWQRRGTRKTPWERRRR